jgi:hypothetical protein
MGILLIEVRLQSYNHARTNTNTVLIRKFSTFFSINTTTVINLLKNKY